MYNTSIILTVASCAGIVCWHEHKYSLKGENHLLSLHIIWSSSTSVFALVFKQYLMQKVDILLTRQTQAINHEQPPARGNPYPGPTASNQNTVLRPLWPNSIQIYYFICTTSSQVVICILVPRLHITALVVRWNAYFLKKTRRDLVLKIMVNNLR